jgi:hypothetical protein
MKVYYLLKFGFKMAFKLFANINFNLLIIYSCFYFNYAFGDPGARDNSEFISCSSYNKSKYLFIYVKF